MAPLLIAGLLAAVMTGCSSFSTIPTEQAIAQSRALPAPDFSKASAWFAFPGRNGLERSTPPGFEPIDEARAQADVFFIHPTTYAKKDVLNAPYDKPGKLDTAVLLGQLTVFNGCCTLYAPEYRQASLRGIPVDEAMSLAYSDIARAFRHYVTHHNRNRPFIIASHSQGTEHAVRLLQEEILGTPLQDRLIVAYTIGAYTPSTLATLGLPACNSARQTGCVVSWNTVQEGRRGALFLVEDVKYWWQGARVISTAPSVCVNPLTWSESGSADAAANRGALAVPRTVSAPTQALRMAPLLTVETGARCTDNLLEVDFGFTSPFTNWLSIALGSYHMNDYGIFYANLRANAVDRVASWHQVHGAAVK